MRGAIPLPIPVPVKGWITDTSPDQLPPDALKDGLNMCIEPDGLLQPRKGMEEILGLDGQVIVLPLPVAPFPPLPNDPETGVPDRRIMAGLGFVDVSGQAQIVISTLQQQFVLDGDHWKDISNVTDLLTNAPAPTINGNKNTPYRLVHFGQKAGKSIVYLVDGAGNDNIMQWTVGTDHFVTVQNLASIPVIAGNPNPLFNAAAPTTFSASDIAVIADRLVVVDTQEVGGDSPFHNSERTRWSAVLDGTNWPAGAWNDEFGSGNMVAVRQSSRTTGVVYAESGGFTLSASLGTDAGAFVFDRINDVIVPPFSPSSIVEIGGRHWFVGEDLNIWVCDGTNAQIFSEQIHSGLLEKLAQGPDPDDPNKSVQRPVAVYDKMRERVIFFVTFSGDDEAHGAICWNQRYGCWETPWLFPDAVTAAFQVTEVIAPTWDSLPATLPNGHPLDWDHASELYATWNDIPASLAPALWVGTIEGLVDRFYVTPLDDGISAIPYFAEWGWRALSAADRLEVNMVEVLLSTPQLNPVTGLPEPPKDSVRLILNGLSTPYEPITASTEVLNALLQENDTTTWVRRLTPIVAQDAFKPANFMRFLMTGNSSGGGPKLAGATLYCFPSKRGDPLVGIAANTATP